MGHQPIVRLFLHIDAARSRTQTSRLGVQRSKHQSTSSRISTIQRPILPVRINFHWLHKIRNFSERKSPVAYLLTLQRRSASHLAVSALTTSLQAFVGATCLVTVTIDGTILFTAFARVAFLIAAPSAILVASYVCRAFLLAVTTTAFLVPDRFSSYYHLLPTVSQLHFVIIYKGSSHYL